MIRAVDSDRFREMFDRFREIVIFERLVAQGFQRFRHHLFLSIFFFSFLFLSFFLCTFFCKSFFSLSLSLSSLLSVGLSVPFVPFWRGVRVISNIIIITQREAFAFFEIFFLSLSSLSLSLS